MKKTKTLQKKRLSLKASAFMLLLSSSIIPLSAEEKVSFRRDYLKGNLTEKAEAVKKTAAAGDNSLSLEALDFALYDLYPTAGKDEDVGLFLVSIIDSLEKASSSEESSRISSDLVAVFRIVEDDGVRISALKGMDRICTPDCVSVINAYLGDCMQKGRKENEVIHTAISVLKDNANRSSFNILFLAHITDIWPSYNDEIVSIYDSQISSYAKDVVTISSVLPSEQKLKVLSIVESNPAFTDSVRGELYENLFNDIRAKAADRDFTSQDVELEMSVMEHLAALKWTRAASKATSFLEEVSRQYDEGIITSHQFSELISDIVQVSNTAETAQALTAYLDSVNTLMARNINTPDEIVLTVIDSLGKLGDKTAFDYLLAVGYFNYSKEVKDAAQEALARLKW